MTNDPQRDDDTDIEEMAELGAFERHHRKVARSLGVSSRSLGLLWLVSALFLIGVGVVVWGSLR